jgi:hypothetical protein
VRKIGPRIHLAAITLLWGACMVGMGFVKNWEEMAGLRVLLGFLEAGESTWLSPSSTRRLGETSENVLTEDRLLPQLCLPA